MKKFLIAAAPLFLTACGGSGDDTTLSRLADDVISYVTTGRTVAENQRALVAGQGCGTDASLFGNGDCKVDSGAVMGFVDRNGSSAIAPLSGARSTVYAVNAPVEDWGKPGHRRLHPLGNSADVMIVDLPPAASQLDQPGRGDGPVASRKDEAAKTGNRHNGDTDTPPVVAQKDMASLPDDAPRTETAALPDAKPASNNKDRSAQETAGTDNVNGPQASVAPDAMQADAPGKMPDVEPGHVSKSKLPPAPAGAKAVNKTSLKGGVVGPDAHKQASGQDAFETSARDAVSAGKYVVLGSFNSQKRARIALDQFSQYHPQLIPATVEGTPYLRIAVGPMNMARANDLRLVTAKNGVKDSWILNIVGSGE
ncbi:SPOR domain-containing protein [Thalassospira sp. TSL5-1]|uniref:SPOR domain-containing protein n=1 Tax=Thalassospira sp. TSL5-1 TaxID=1544451 RepID=UPI0009395D6A|nr:SPOR domain-containing protein [Thalassospira sp. TSL5-1]OKH89403.1 hypothetical protein LF95_05290 [Thalassospira sp. TSL5-1]